MKRSRRQNSGFILLTALAMLAIVGVAILTLASAMSYDGQRTFENATRAQLDQMLLAGAADANEHFKKATPKPGDAWGVELPNVLTEQDATLHIAVDSADDSKIKLDVSARINSRSAEQVLQFERQAGQWKLVSAEIPVTSP
jgi:hypothetical protein